jgi:hypothetical protein
LCLRSFIHPIEPINTEHNKKREQNRLQIVSDAEARAGWWLS